MKSAITLLIFLFAITFTNAQEIASIPTDDTVTVEEVSTTDVKTVGLDHEEISNACYGEVSKAAFYKALLEENGFDTELEEAKKETPSYALRNTEDIIKRHKNRISYSE